MTQAGAGGAEEWGGVLDGLIVGVAHHLNNRVATLSGVSDILMLAGDEAVSPPLRLLMGEIPKLEEAVRLLRLLARSDEPEEAVEPARLVADAVALARLYPDLEGVTFTVEARNAPPVLVHPVALTHAILLTLVRAARDVVCSRGHGDHGGIMIGADPGGTAHPRDASGVNASGVTSAPAVVVTLRTMGDELIISAGRYSVPACRLLASR